MNRQKIIILLLLMAIGIARFGSATAASSPTGLTVSPAFQQVSINADTAKQPVTFTVTNDKSSPQTLDLSVADFNTLSESGGLFFVGTNPTAIQKKYGLAKWVELPQKQITVLAHQTTTINANILNLPDLSPGGHYAALMLAIAGSENQNSNVTVHPIASSLLFVTKLGGDTHKLSIANVIITKTLFKLPSSVTLRFYNNGNTHVIPRGVVNIFSPTHKLVSKGIINEDSGIILPQTYRRFTVPLHRLTNAALPGRYKLEVDFRFDGLAQPRAYQSSIFLLPIQLVIVTLIVLMIIIFVVLYLFVIRRKKNNRYIHRK